MLCALADGRGDSIDIRIELGTCSRFANTEIAVDTNVDSTDNAGTGHCFLNLSRGTINGLIDFVS